MCPHQIIPDGGTGGTLGGDSRPGLLAGIWAWVGDRRTGQAGNEAHPSAVHDSGPLTPAPQHERRRFRCLGPTRRPLPASHNDVNRVVSTTSRMIRIINHRRLIPVRRGITRPRPTVYPGAGAPHMPVWPNQHIITGRLEIIPLRKGTYYFPCLCSSNCTALIKSGSKECLHI